VYVVRQKWHIDIGFAAPDVAAPLSAVARSLPRATYLMFGFGDRHYLLARDKGAPDLLAALWPGPALILLTSIENSPAQAFGADEVIALRMSAAQSQAIQAFIWRSLSTPSEPMAPGPYEGSLYFAAVPHYSGFHTCNTWAAEALRSAGLPLRSAGVLFAGQLWREVQRLAASGPTAGPRASLPAAPSPNSQP
jgi:hypothetical protein